MYAKIAALFNSQLKMHQPAQPNDWNTLQLQFGNRFCGTRAREQAGLCYCAQENSIETVSDTYDSEGLFCFNSANRIAGHQNQSR